MEIRMRNWKGEEKMRVEMGKKERRIVELAKEWRIGNGNRNGK